MNSNIETITDRQFAIANEEAPSLPLPKYDSYAICNLRGGIGKTTIAFNLSYETDDILMVDTCPQGNLSYFYDENYYNNNAASVKDLILSYLIPGMGKPARVARNISATNSVFENKNAFYIPSSNDLYTLPSQLATALNQIKSLPPKNHQVALDSMLFSLRDEIAREMRDLELERCLIDTSPFFSGATHLAWHATDALLVPIRVDQQSINSFELLLNTLSSPSGEFRRDLPSDQHTPSIQLVILTHCTWSTRAGARNVPNQQTKVFLEKTLDIVHRNIAHFTTRDPCNHILLLDDFLGTGRISTALSKPVATLSAGDSMRINRVKTTVNASVEKIKSQLRYISQSIW